MTKKKKPKLQPQIIQGGINIKGNAVIKNSKVAGRDNVEKKITNISYSFAPVYHAIEKSPNITPETQKAVEQSVKEIEHEVKKGSKARGTFIPEQMFAKTINAMKQSRRQVIEGVPETVIDMNVVCYDRVSQFAVMAASWSDVKDYLLGQINDYQFGSRIKRGNLP